MFYWSYNIQYGCPLYFSLPTRLIKPSAIKGLFNLYILYFYSNLNESNLKIVCKPLEMNDRPLIHYPISINPTMGIDDKPPESHQIFIAIRNKFGATIEIVM